VSLPGAAETLRRTGLAADKRLGQHFLVDPAILRRIAQAAAPLDAGTVVEIGPGPGGLTGALLDAGATRLVAVERDSRWVAALEPLVGAAGGRLDLRPGDALALDLDRLVPEGPIRIVANLPYNVATPLLLRWLEKAERIAVMVLMFQREVARRLTAQPGSDAYGRLAVQAQWRCEVETLFDLPPGAFRPPPKVSSSVVRLRPRPAPLFAAEPGALSAVLAAGFGQRRKMLRSSLAATGVDPLAITAAAGIDPTRRAETLPIEAWCRLARAFSALARPGTSGRTPRDPAGGDDAAAPR
jgi:16S rRNA (adenine1518-N6/adenine1519-N6)-dimethyltransferase